MNVRALELRLEALADDVGRLRRRLDPESSAGYLVDRIRGHVASIWLIATPSASELSSIFAPGDPEALQAAIEITDEEWSALLRRMRGRRRP